MKARVKIMTGLPTRSHKIHILSSEVRIKLCAKMKFLLFFKISWWDGGCQDHSVSFSCLPSSGTRVTSRKSLLLESLPKRFQNENRQEKRAVLPSLVIMLPNWSWPSPPPPFSRFSLRWRPPPPRQLSSFIFHLSHPPSSPQRGLPFPLCSSRWDKVMYWCGKRNKPI